MQLTRGSECWKMPRVRIATVPYANAAPLIWGLADRFLPDRCDLVEAPPAHIPDMLRSGQADAGLIPVIELPRVPGARAVPAVCVASRERARSVLLVATRPLEEVRRIALDASSRSSAALLRVILAHRRLARIEFTERAPSLADMLRDHDAALLIGDAALLSDTAGLMVYDLAEEWRRMTRLPFVFAVWAIRPGAAIEAAPFVDACREGLAHLDQIARREAARLRLPEETLLEYFRVNLHYHLGPEERRGLDLFFSRAHDLGLVQAPQPLRFLSETAAVEGLGCGR